MIGELMLIVVLMIFGIMQFLSATFYAIPALKKRILNESVTTRNELTARQIDRKAD